MAEITVKRQGELIRKVFEILLPHSEGIPAKTVLEQVEGSIPLTDFERSTYATRPNIRRITKIIRFSTITVSKAGWLVKSKGTWSLSDEGKQAYERFKDPEIFYRESIRLYRQWRAGVPEVVDPIPEEGPAASTTLEEAEESAWAEVQRYLSEINPYDLQKLVAALLRVMGYHVSWIAPPGPDAGIDILAFGDPLGTQSPRIKVQVKRRGDRINTDGLKAFMALIGDKDVGIFVCTGGFTRDTEALARSQETRKITLIDIERLFDLWVEHYRKIPDEEKLLLPLKPVYYLAPAD